MTGDIIDSSWYDKPSGIPEHACAGGIVVRRDRDRVLVALCRQAGYDDYIIPKGHIETDESIEAAARREIEEEAGFSELILLGELGARDRLDFRKEAWRDALFSFPHPPGGSPSYARPSSPPTSLA